jgi:hypothetical protein
MQRRKGNADSAAAAAAANAPLRRPRTFGQHAQILPYGDGVAMSSDVRPSHEEAAKYIQEKWLECKARVRAQHERQDQLRGAGGPMLGRGPFLFSPAANHLLSRPSMARFERAISHAMHANLARTAKDRRVAQTRRTRKQLRAANPIGWLFGCAPKNGGKGKGPPPQLDLEERPSVRSVRV